MTITAQSGQSLWESPGDRQWEPRGGAQPSLGVREGSWKQRWSLEEEQKFKRQPPLLHLPFLHGTLSIALLSESPLPSSIIKKGLGLSSHPSIRLSHRLWAHPIFWSCAEH